MDTPVRRPRIDPKFASYKLSIRKSKIHRFGVYAEERIPANRKVIEYTGERLNRARNQAPRRRRIHLSVYAGQILDTRWRLRWQRRGDHQP